MRRSYVQVGGVLYEKGTEPLSQTHHVMPDFKAPYKSMITGEMIPSRAAHREHLKKHGCVEVGNEVKAHMAYYDKVGAEVREKQRASARELIAAQVRDMTHQQFRAAIKKDADFVKWNSRDG